MCCGRMGVTRAKIRAVSFGGGDEPGERWDVCRVGYGESVAEELEEGDVEFLAGLHACEHRIACLTAGVGSGAAGNLALGDVANR